jgi:hypothetical protein
MLLTDNDANESKNQNGYHVLPFAYTKKETVCRVTNQEAKK